MPPLWTNAPILPSVVVGIQYERTLDRISFVIITCIRETHNTCPGVLSTLKIIAIPLIIIVTEFYCIPLNDFITFF